MHMALAALGTVIPRGSCILFRRDIARAMVCYIAHQHHLVNAMKLAQCIIQSKNHLQSDASLFPIVFGNRITATFMLCPAS
ncbi:hypothetical protein F5Y12DRAFT_519839 [Xylaria sp. FL1777]|nr:hypothetical protein F5Y12DRAFT_519839 [Xylaria sp. FL1777]